MNRRERCPKAVPRRLAAAAFAAAWLALGPAAAEAQQAQTSLPEMNVTAPRNQAAPEWYRPNPGFWGKLRVEEDKWPEIPCGESHVNLGAAAAAAGTKPGKCQDGWRVLPGQHDVSRNRCSIHHPLITVDIGRFSVEADVLLFDPYLISADFRTTKGCTILYGYRNLPDDFRDMNQVARRGVGWHNFEAGSGQPGAQSTMQFSDGDHGCVALERFGPYWQGGFIWVLHATMCKTDAAPVLPTDIDTVVAALHIHTYDPAGNLVPPPAR
jgi:hypothetical protein